MREYEAIFASPLGPEQIQAIATLFELSCSAEREDAMATVDAAAA
jgi:hypothetical protein